LPGGGHALAAPPVITSASCYPQYWYGTLLKNALRYDCDVQATGATEVWVRWRFPLWYGWGYPPAEYCDGTGSSSHEAPGPGADVTIYGLCPSTWGYWQAFASNADGTTALGGVPFMTPDLPPTLANIEVTMTGTPGGTEYVMLNYGCGTYDPDDGLDEENNDWIVVLDTEGYVRWYENPGWSLFLYETPEFAVEALANPRVNGNVMFIVNHEYIVEVTLEGDVEHIYCRDASCSKEDEALGLCDFGTECDDAWVVPDNTWDTNTYVHHDLVRADDQTYALSAEVVSAPNPSGMCDTPAGDLDLTIDGVIAFDRTTNEQTLDWDLTEVYGYYDASTNPGGVGYTNSRCGGAAGCAGPYWTGLLDGCDWAHLNSIWIDDADQWLLSLKNPSTIVSVDSTTSPAAKSWDLCNATPGGCTYNLGTGAAYRFSEQHAALWMADPDTSMLFFDNEHGDLGDADARALMVDWSGTSPTIAASYDIEHVDGRPAYCATGGSVLDISGTGYLLATCATDSDADDRHPIVNEFALEGGAATWVMEVWCPTRTVEGVEVPVRTRPSYRGYPVGL
jgi:hypothetical protein